MRACSRIFKSVLRSFLGGTSWHLEILGGHQFESSKYFTYRKTLRTFRGAPVKKDTLYNVQGDFLQCTLFLSNIDLILLIVHNLSKFLSKTQCLCLKGQWKHHCAMMDNFLETWWGHKYKCIKMGDLCGLSKNFCNLSKLQWVKYDLLSQIQIMSWLCAFSYIIL